MRVTRIFVVAIIVTAIGLMHSSFGQEFAGLLRDETALGLKPTVSNWGMGGAYLGVPDATSMNPAALAFNDSRHVTASTGHWNPDVGANVNSARLDAVIPIDQMNGSIRILGEWFGSRKSDTLRIGPGDTDFHATTLGLQAGVALSEKIGLGIAMYPYEKAKIRYDAPASNATMIDAEAMSQLGSIQGGLQWRVLPQLTFGVTGIYIIDEMKANTFTRAGRTDEADDYYISYGAAGICWEPWDKTRIAVDYWTGEVEGEQSALTGGGDYDVDIDRWAFGIAQDVGMDTTVRIGSKNGGLTCGLGHRFNESISVNYVYVDEAFRDKEVAFDQVQLHKIALTYTY